MSVLQEDAVGIAQQCAQELERIAAQLTDVQRAAGSLCRNRSAGQIMRLQDMDSINQAVALVAEALRAVTPDGTVCAEKLDALRPVHMRDRLLGHQDDQIQSDIELF